MRAKLYVEGKKFKIFLIEEKPEKCEILIFFKKRKMDLRSIVASFRKLLASIADNDVEEIRDTKQYKEWQEAGCTLRELRKGDYRLTFFKQGNCFIFATWFIKTEQNEKKEYVRAVNLFNRYLQNPEPEENNGKNEMGI